MHNRECDFLSRFVASYRRKLVALRIADVSMTVLMSFLGLYAVLQLVFAFFPWTVLPAVFDAACAGAGLFIVGHAFFAATFGAPGQLRAAREIERRSAVKGTYLSIALELSGDSRTAGNPFSAAACSRAAAHLGSCPRTPRLPRRTAVRAAATGALGLWCLLNPVGLSPSLVDFWALPFLPAGASGAVVSPGSMAVPGGATVRLRLHTAAGSFPSSRCVTYTPDGGRLSNVLLRPDSNGVFEHRLDSVQSSFLYRFSYGRSLSRMDTVTVVPLPLLQRLIVRVRPPRYMRQAARALPEGQGNFDAYEGSTARMTIESARIAQAALVRGRPPQVTTGAGRHNDTVPLAVEGPAASGEIMIKASCDYRFVITDTLGQKNDSLPVFHIECIPDEPPVVQIIKPGYSRDLEPAQVETLSVEGVDDVGIRSLVLKWEKPGREAGVRDLSDPSFPPLIRTAFIWRLAELSLYPGDTVYYWAEIADTKPSGRRRKGFSDTFFFRIPTFEEIHRRIVERTSSAERTIGAVRRKQEDLENRLENAMKSLSGSRELSWEQKEILRDVRREFRAQADSLRQAMKALRENVERMKREGSVGEELARKFDRARAAVDSLVREYGDSLLFSKEDMERPLSLNEFRRAVEKMNAVLPRLGEQLDNLIRFLEMLKEDRRLAGLAMRAERLSREQGELYRKEYDGTMPARQKELLDRIQNLSREAGARAQKGGAASEPPWSKAAVDSLLEAMRSALGRAPGMPSRETMNQMRGALLSLSQDLMQMMQFREGMRMAKERGRLLSLAGDALALSEWQEDLRRSAARSGADRAVSARSQQALRDALARSSDAADSLSMLSPQDMAAVGSGFRRAAEASGRVIDVLGSGRGVMRAMAGSAESLRSLAGTLLSSVDNIDNGSRSSCSGGACMMPGLRRISGRQAAVNSMTADLLRQLLRGGSPAGGGAEGGEEAEARRAAREAQEAVAEELRRLSEKYGREAGEGMRGRVDRLEEEARRLAAMLRRPVPDIVERQDRFLARMLETTLSMHRRGEGKDEWKSRTAETVFSTETEAAPESFFRDADLFHRLRQKAYRGNYPSAYRSAVRAYFDALSEKYLK